MLTLWKYGGRGREILDNRRLPAFKMRNPQSMKGIYDFTLFPLVFPNTYLEFFFLFSYSHYQDTNTFLSVHVLQCHHAFGACAERQRSSPEEIAGADAFELGRNGGHGDRRAQQPSTNPGSRNHTVKFMHSPCSFQEVTSRTIKLTLQVYLRKVLTYYPPTMYSMCK